jgi:hypothetical protein
MVGPMSGVGHMRFRRASDVFTDRRPYSESYRDTVRRHDRDLNAGTAARDLPRKNIITFYGMGGIGKTQLMRRLERWTVGDDDEEMRSLWGPPPLGGRRVYTSRFDLAEAEPWDIDRLLLSLRATAAEARVETRAFDVGLVARWSVVRPGEPMPDIGRRSGIELAALVKQAAIAALSQLGVPFGAGWITDRVSERLQYTLTERRKLGTIADCSQLGEVLQDIEQERDGVSAAAIASLLDWDLGILPSLEQPRWVVFVDGFERAQEAGARTEDLIHRVVFGTPHLLWVVAGQRRLDWAEANIGTLAHGGAVDWPTLAAAPDSAQHLLGGLAPEDAGAFLDRSLVTRDGDSLLSPEARDAIVAASEGIPIYLDLSFQHAQRLLWSGRPLTPEQFGGPLPGLVARVAAGLPADERRVLNAAVLVRSFDADLIAAGGDVEQGVAHRFVERPMVTAAADGRHQLHQIVRRTVRRLPPTSEGAWAPGDWSKAGARMLEVLKARLRDTENADAQLRCALAAYDVAADLGLRVDWALTALMEHPARGRTAAAIAGRTAGEHAGAWTRSVEALVACWQEGPHDDDLQARLQALVDRGELTNDIRRRALRHRAYRLRTLGDHSGAGELFVQLRNEPDGDNALLRFQHGMTLTHLGRLREAEELRVALDDAGEDSKARRLVGEIHLHHGRVAESADAVAARANHAKERRDFHNELDNRVGEIRRRALIDTACMDLIDDVIAMTQQHAAIGHLRSALCAKALCLAGDREAMDAVLGERRAWATPGRSDGSLAELFVLAFDAAIRADNAMMADVERRLDRLGDVHDMRWLRPLLWWKAATLEQDAPAFGAVQWLDPEDVVRDRWLDVVRGRRSS